MRQSRNSHDQRTEEVKLDLALAYNGTYVRGRFQAFDGARETAADVAADRDELRRIPEWLRVGSDDPETSLVAVESLAARQELLGAVMGHLFGGGMVPSVVGERLGGLLSELGLVPVAERSIWSAVGGDAGWCTRYLAGAKDRGLISCSLVLTDAAAGARERRALLAVPGQRDRVRGLLLDLCGDVLSARPAAERARLTTQRLYGMAKGWYPELLGGASLAVIGQVWNGEERATWSIRLKKVTRMLDAVLGSRVGLRAGFQRNAAACEAYREACPRGWETRRARQAEARRAKGALLRWRA